MSEGAGRVLGVLVCDLERSAIGTRSRLGDVWGAADGAQVKGRTVLAEVVRRLLKVEGLGEIAVLAPAPQVERVWALIGPEDRVKVLPLERRSAGLDERVRIGRAWNLLSWRGGAGQWTVFDEEYHPNAIAGAMAAAFDGIGGGGRDGADHVFLAHSHGVLLDSVMAGKLIDHHLHKNRQTPFSYTPAAPGLCGMLFPAEAVRKMAEHQMLPHQWLEYNPLAPTFDTLIRDACMQVDPALSKIPNRFCVDTHRFDTICKDAAKTHWGSVAEMCAASGRGVAPGIVDLSRVFAWPREVEIELTAARLTEPAGVAPAEIRGRRQMLDAEHWVRWFERQGYLRAECDDLLLTIGGDGDPLLFGGGESGGKLREVLLAARAAGVLSICVQTDLAVGGGDVDGLLRAAGEGLVDVVSVMFYGFTPATYAKVAGADLHGAVMRNMGRLAEVTRGRGGVPLVIPRLLKVRETIGEMEPFFDFWIERCGWAVMDGPTDRAGAVPFAGVVDMAPPRRKACRRLWDRMVVRADGRAVACDQDVNGKLPVGHIESMGIREMWGALQDLRNKHAAGMWNQVDPCMHCREWHRA